MASCVQVSTIYSGNTHQVLQNVSALLSSVQTLLYFIFRPIKLMFIISYSATLTTDITYITGHGDFTSH